MVISSVTVISPVTCHLFFTPVLSAAVFAGRFFGSPCLTLVRQFVINSGL